MREGERKEKERKRKELLAKFTYNYGHVCHGDPSCSVCPPGKENKTWSRLFFFLGAVSTETELLPNSLDALYRTVSMPFLTLFQ